MSPRPFATTSRLHALALVLAAASTARADTPSPSPAPPSPAAASPAVPPSTLVALVPSADDARRSIAIGTRGEVYEPDGAGAWVRRQRLATSEPLSLAGRAGASVIGWGNGVVYRLAANGWSAIRLHQKQRAIASGGVRAIAAVGRQLFALDRRVNGEPAKLAVAPSSVIAIGAGPRGVVVQLDRGLFRLRGAGLAAIANAPKAITKLVGDRWALVEDGAIDLETGRKTGLPPTSSVVVAAMMDDERLVLVLRDRGALEVGALAPKAAELVRTPLAVPPPPAGAPAPEPVGVVVDPSGRAVVAMRDGVLLVRDTPSAPWTTARVTDDLPASPNRGPAPARSR